MTRKTVSYNPSFSEKWIFYLSPPEWRGKVDVEFVDVPLSSLEHAGCWTDPNVVAGWVRTLEDGKPIPPPVAVLTERGTYYLHDGNHRYEALTQFFKDLSGNHNEAVVRIAVATPLPGHEFVYRRCGEYGTYSMQDRPVRFETMVRAVIALLASAIALAVTASLPGVDRTPVYALLVLSVMITAWAGGWKAGLLASIFNSGGSAYFMLPPNGSLMIAKPDQAIQFAITALVMVAVAFLMQIVRRHPSIELGIRATRSHSSVVKCGRVAE